MEKKSESPCVTNVLTPYTFWIFLNKLIKMGKLIRGTGREKFSRGQP